LPDRFWGGRPFRNSGRPLSPSELAAHFRYRLGDTVAVRAGLGVVRKAVLSAANGVAQIHHRTARGSAEAARRDRAAPALAGRRALGVGAAPTWQYCQKPAMCASALVDDSEMRESLPNGC